MSYGVCAAERMAAGSSDELVLVPYAASGWDTYPANNAFGLPAVLDRETAVGDLQDMRLEEAQCGHHQDYVAAWLNDGVLSAVAGSMAGGVFEFRRLADISGIAADTLSIGTSCSDSASSAPPTVCLAFHPADGGGGSGAVHVRCADGPLTSWADLGVAIEDGALVERLAVEVAVTDARVVVAARSAQPLRHNHLVVRWTQLPTSGGLVEWKGRDLVLDAPVTHFELGVRGENVYLAVSERFGEGLRVMQTTL